MIIRIHPEAEAEFLHSVDFYSEESFSLAERFIAEFETATDDISFAPMRFPLFEEGTRIKLLDKFPFSLVFDVVGNEIHILTVMHQSREPGFWHDRIRDGKI